MPSRRLLFRNIRKIIKKRLKKRFWTRFNAYNSAERKLNLLRRLRKRKNIMLPIRPITKNTR